MDKKIRVLILEDEFITLDNLRETIEDLGYSISGTAMQAERAIAILEKGATDIAILDIQLKGEKSGIWVAQQINKKYHIPFIFLTAFSDKNTVIQAADTSPSGYLVKPFNNAGIFTSIAVAMQNYNTTKEEQEISEGVISGNNIYIKENSEYKKLQLSDILYVQAFKNYLEIWLIGNRSHLIRSTLKDFRSQLPNIWFLQPHRSYLVNIQHIEKVGQNAVWVNEIEIPISRRLKEDFLNKLALN